MSNVPYRFRRARLTCCGHPRKASVVAGRCRACRLRVSHRARQLADAPAEWKQGSDWLDRERTHAAARVAGPRRGAGCPGAATSSTRASRSRASCSTTARFTSMRLMPKMARVSTSSRRCASPMAASRCVNRGCVPNDLKDASKRAAGQLAGDVAVTGLLRHAGVQGMFTPTTTRRATSGIGATSTPWPQRSVPTAPRVHTLHYRCRSEPGCAWRLAEGRRHPPRAAQPSSRVCPDLVWSSRLPLSPFFWPSPSPAGARRRRTSAASQGIGVNRNKAVRSCKPCLPLACGPPGRGTRVHGNPLFGRITHVELHFDQR